MDKWANGGSVLKYTLGTKLVRNISKWRVVTKAEVNTEAETMVKNTSDDRFKYFYCF